MLGDRKLKLRETADTFKVSEGSVFTILLESLGMSKLFPKWVPRFLTPDHKQQGVEDSERCLELFKRGEKDFLHRHLTMDETWIQHYTSETKRSLAEWTATGESRPNDQKLNSRSVRLWHPYLEMRMVFCLSTLLRKVNSSTANIKWHYWINWAQKSRKNGFSCKRKKCCSTKTMHRATSL